MKLFAVLVTMLVSMNAMAWTAQYECATTDGYRATVTVKHPLIGRDSVEYNDQATKVKSKLEDLKISNEGPFSGYYEYVEKSEMILISSETYVWFPQEMFSDNPPQQATVGWNFIDTSIIGEHSGGRSQPWSYSCVLH